MIRIVVGLVFVTNALAVPIFDLPLLSGAPPETFSSKYAPFREIAGRIISGSPASRGQFPHQAAVYTSTASTTGFCGGSLISPSWVLTAAHCIPGARAITVYLGVISLSDTYGGVTATASSVIGHPQYNSHTVTNDIALILLSSSVATSVNIRIISLATRRLEAGVSVTASGWGDIDDNRSSSDTLKYVTLTTITDQQCAIAYRSPSTKPGVVCTIGASIEGACEGDSGGPLIIGSGTSAVQVGISSYVHPTGCVLGYPNGFTRVSAYRSWIRQNSGV